MLNRKMLIIAGFFMLPVLLPAQPTGTNASYDGDTVYLTGANANTLQNIKQQIETAAKKKMTGSGNSYRVQLWVDGTGKFSKDIIITLEGNVLTIIYRYG